MSFILSDRYRLELRWQKAHKKDNTVVFEGAYFTGPVLAIADKLNDVDEIRLDFCFQYTILVKHIYVATFKWKGVSYKENRIELGEAMLVYDKDVENAPTLKHTDYIVIDTRQHENEKHYYNMFYPAFVVSNENILYKFGR